MQEHKKNRDPDDLVFLEFGRLVLKNSWDWSDYDRMAQEILTLEPEPWGPGIYREPAVIAPPPVRKKSGKKKRTVRCGICSGEGHNARGCPNKPDTPTVKHTDGFERLSPGFDPNPSG